MLVLSRMKDEQIVIRVPGRENPIYITLVEPRGDRARIGVHADKDIRVDRLEVDELRQKGSHETP